jgi:predicted NACHT family NTPase
MGSGMISPTPVQIEEALRDKQRVVVLGDPGSGKGTMLKYLALRLAKDIEAPLPILLPLNSYARSAIRNSTYNPIFPNTLRRAPKVWLR